MNFSLVVVNIGSEDGVLLDERIIFKVGCSTCDYVGQKNYFNFDKENETTYYLEFTFGVCSYD